MGYIMPATYDHACALAPNLRAEDQDEIRLLTSGQPLATVVIAHATLLPALSMFSSKGELAGMCGVAPHQDGWRVWMFGTKLLEEKPMEFLRDSHKWVASALDRYGRLCNIVHAANQKHVAWLEWLGFTVDYDSPQTINGGIFYPFEKTKECA